MEQRTALETKLKEIDEQITILNDLKVKHVAQLQSLSQSSIYQPMGDSHLFFDFEKSGWRNPNFWR